MFIPSGIFHRCVNYSIRWVNRLSAHTLLLARVSGWYGLFVFTKNNHPLSFHQSKSNAFSDWERRVDFFTCLFMNVWYTVFSMNLPTRQTIQILRLLICRHDYGRDCEHDDTYTRRTYSSFLVPRRISTALTTTTGCGSSSKCKSAAWAFTSQRLRRICCSSSASSCSSLPPPFSVARKFPVVRRQVWP